MADPKESDPVEVLVRQTTLHRLSGTKDVTFWMATPPISVTAATEDEARARLADLLAAIAGKLRAMPAAAPTSAAVPGLPDGDVWAVPPSSSADVCNAPCDGTVPISDGVTEWWPCSSPKGHAGEHSSIPF